MSHAKNDSFISYSRRDKPFVESLVGELKKHDRDVWVDWEDIPPTAEWFDEIKRGIENADNFIFVISPDSAQSAICTQELEYALKHHKRLIPLLYREVANTLLHPVLSSHNWIQFDGQNLAEGLNKLVLAMDTDLDYTRTHTRLLARAIEWDARKRNESLLLRGQELIGYESWLSHAANATPRPTDLQTEFIFASRRAQVSRQRNTIRLLGVGLVVMVGLVVWALYNNDLAVRSQAVAEREAEISRSLLLADKARQAWEDNNIEPALALAVEANSIQNAPPRSQRILADVFYTPNLRGQVSYPATITDLSISPDGRLFAFSAYDGRVILIDRVEEKERVVFQDADSMPIRTVAFMPSDGGKTLIGGAMDGTIYSWDTLTLQPIDRIGGVRDNGSREGMNAIVRDMDASAATTTFVTGSARGEVILWDMNGLTPVQRYNNHNDAVLGVALSEDGAYVATGSEDNLIVVRDIQQEIISVLRGGDDNVQALAFHPLNSNILAASYGDYIIIWDAVQRRRELLRLNDEVPRAHHDTIQALAYTPDGQTLVSGSDDGVVVVWNLDRGVPLASYLQEGASITALQITPDGKSIVATASRAGGGGAIFVWDLASPGVKNLYRVHSDEVRAVSYSPDGSRIAAVSNDGSLSILETESGEPLAQIANHNAPVTAVAYGETFIVSGSTNGSLFLIDPDTGTILRMLTVFSPINAITLLPDGRIAIGLDSNNVEIWRPDGSRPDTILEGAHTRPVLTLEISTDGTMLASGSADNTIALWDLATGTVLRKLEGHTRRVLDIDFTPDGTALYSTALDGVIIAWDVATGGIIDRTMVGESPVWALDFSPSGDHFVTGAADGNISLWDTQARTSVRRFSVHRGGVLSVSFGPDGESVISGSRDRTIIRWSMPTPGELSTVIRAERQVDAVSCDALRVYDVTDVPCRPSTTTTPAN